MEFIFANTAKAVTSSTQSLTQEKKIHGQKLSLLRAGDKIGENFWLYGSYQFITRHPLPY